MTDEKKSNDPDLDFGWDVDDEAGAHASARPTLAPPFDLETYAKEAMVPSGPGPGSAPPGGRPTPAAGQEVQVSGPHTPPIIPNRVISLPPPQQSY